MARQIASFDANAETTEIAATLREEGAVIIREVIPRSVMDRLVTAIQPFLEVSPSKEFYGDQVRTCGNAIGRDPRLAEPLLLGPAILDALDGTLLPERPMGPSNPRPQTAGSAASYDQNGLCAGVSRDDVTGPNCNHYRLGASVAIQVGAKGGCQGLHRDMDIYRPFIEQDPDRPTWMVTVNYAGTDYTTENGATRVVLGSHRWPKDREPQAHEEVQAVMPKGSAVLVLGQTLHALGPNHTDEKRTGFTVLFSANWLTQEENQFVSVPPEMAEKFPEPVQQLLGYRGASIGWASGRDSENILRPGRTQYV